MKKLLAVFLGLSLLGLLFFSLFQINSVSGDAMSPTLKSRQNLLFWKYGTGNLKRGDIVLYRPKDKNGTQSDMDWVSRIVGLPTESIRIENGNLYIDNNVEKLKVEEEYLGSGTATKAYEEGKWMKIGEFEYMILADKRENTISIPSRMINKNDIKGVLVWKF
ncbi:MAG: signal peptidase I [Candidatus Woesebacteria bacterium]|nr:signal peptidase I [Candidatus Woesebacteria bacterium]